MEVVGLDGPVSIGIRVSEKLRVRPSLFAYDYKIPRFLKVLITEFRQNSTLITLNSMHCCLELQGLLNIVRIIVSEPIKNPL